MKTIKLSDLQLLFIDGDRGINYPKSSDFKKEGYCLFLDSTNVGDLGFDFGSTHFISKEKSDSMGNGKLCRYDIIITTRGSIGKVALYDESIPFDNIRINSGMLIIRASSPQEAVNVYCQLKSPYVQQQIRVFCSGSVQKQLTQPIIKDLKIYDGLSQSTSSFLMNIENFLKNINNQSKELESLAKTIYDHWFLQFDFPNEEGKPYKSSGGAMEYNEELKMDIPKGWEVHKLGGLTTLDLGGTPKTEVDSYWNGDINWLNSGEVAQFPVVCTEAKITNEGMNNSATKMMKKGTVVVSITGNIRTSILGIDSCGNQSIVGIRETNQLKKSYIYPNIFHLLDHYVHLSTGNCQQHINKETLLETNIIVPPNCLLNKYYEIVEPMYEQIINNGNESFELTSLRDYLLPLLMNGQVGFKDE